MNKQSSKKTDKSRGFTIIEVVLVLAIAGLIFLMVFIALPALQRSQRDTQRKQDVARISTQLTNYSSSSRGAIPNGDTLAAFVKGYLGGGTGTASCNNIGQGNAAGDSYTDPSGCNYQLVYTTNTGSLQLGEIAYHDQSQCSDGTIVTNQTIPQRDYALAIKLEGQSAAYCVDNQS